MSYTTIAAAQARAIERSLVAVDPGVVTELLTFSAGVAPNGVTHFRPYYVAAKLAEQDQSRQSIASADGATFTGLVRPIASLYATQAAIDSALELKIPAGFEARIDTASATKQRQTRSFTPTVRP